MHKLETYKSLLALSVGDAAGENHMKLLPAHYYKAGNVGAERGLTAVADVWPWTDDTHLAIGVVRTLFRYDTIDQLALAKEFAANFHQDCQRGYGRGTFGLLKVLYFAPETWETQSKNWWGPDQGSKGNGSAMRDSVIGSFFGQDYGRVAVEARKSAEVTHYHEEAIAGSIAVAIASTLVTYGDIKEYWSTILTYTPSGPLREAIKFVATDEAANETNWGIVGVVGNGSKVTALDTVPFALWQAHQAILHNSFEGAITSIIEVGGDTDTIGAMVGGIIGNKVYPPTEWIEQTEPLPKDLCL